MNVQCRPCAFLSTRTLPLRPAYRASCTVTLPDRSFKLSHKKQSFSLKKNIYLKPSKYNEKYDSLVLLKFNMTEALGTTIPRMTWFQIKIDDRCMYI